MSRRQTKVKHLEIEEVLDLVLVLTLPTPTPTSTRPAENEAKLIIVLGPVVGWLELQHNWFILSLRPALKYHRNNLKLNCFLCLSNLNNGIITQIYFAKAKKIKHHSVN